MHSDEVFKDHGNVGNATSQLREIGWSRRVVGLLATFYMGSFKA